MLRRPVRFFFSGYFVSAVLIILEIAAIFWLVLEATAYSGYILATVLIICLASALVVVNADYNPEYKITWLVIIIFLPLFGTILFILFRTKKMSHRDARRMNAILSAMDDIATGEVPIGELRRTSALAAGKAQAIITDSPTSTLFRGTSSRFFSVGEDMYEAMLADMESAKRFIFLEYFIIEGGVMWDGILEILKRKVDEGVEVRVMYDDVGSMSTLPRGFVSSLRSYGISVATFGKVYPRVSSAHNNRDHRKFLIVDGTVGYTGGINIADEYINEIQRFGYWKDGGIRLCGDAVVGFTKLFLLLWDVTTGGTSDYEKYLCTAPVSSFCDLDGIDNDDASNRNILPAVNADARNTEDDGGFYLPFGSGPVPIYRRHVGERCFLDLINQAQRYIYITTPYLIINHDLTDALRGAALRGVDVRIITPGTPDKKIVKMLTKSAYPYLMEAGVKIYEYAPGFIHEKTVVSDDEYAVVGSINFDYRSLIHHYEDAVWMFSSPTIPEIRAEYERTLAECRIMTRKRARLTLKERAVRVIIRLFAPLL